MDDFRPPRLRALWEQVRPGDPTSQATGVRPGDPAIQLQVSDHGVQLANYRAQAGDLCSYSCCRRQAKGSSYPSYRSQAQDPAILLQVLNHGVQIANYTAQAVRSGDPVIQAAGARPKDPTIQATAVRPGGSNCPAAGLRPWGSDSQLSSPSS